MNTTYKHLLFFTTGILCMLFAYKGFEKIYMTTFKQSPVDTKDNKKELVNVVEVDNTATVEDLNFSSVSTPHQKETKPNIKTPLPINNEDRLKRSVYNCFESTKADQQACQKAANIILERFPDIDISQVTWVDIDNMFDCHVNQAIEARFFPNNERVEVEFEISGYLIEIEYEEKKVSALPDKVKIGFENYLKNNQGRLKEGNKQLSDYKYYELENTPGIGMLYEFEIEGDRDVDITFNSSGEKIKNYCED